MDMGMGGVVGGVGMCEGCRVGMRAVGQGSSSWVSMMGEVTHPRPHASPKPDFLMALGLLLLKSCDAKGRDPGMCPGPDPRDRAQGTRQVCRWP